uniref:Poly [ADP-ribose] polymerase n=1 Tax=Poecilia reticulata TaxID=8081 RepID=A0A3P9N3D0_POERE
MKEKMDTSDTPWYWYYLEDCGRWHRVEVNLYLFLRFVSFSRLIFQVCRTSHAHSFGLFPAGIGSNVCFCAAMLQTDLATGKQRRIQRKFSLEKSLISCKVKVKPLELTSEYKTVADYVSHDGLLSKSIVSISRIQNLELWEIYCRKKRQLMKIKHVQDIPERRLFHGTDTKNVDSICKYNFDLRIPKKNGRTFGNGIYFAIHASFADKYSTNSTLHGNTKSIFLARVMVGKCNLGKPDLLKPDDENAFDSCVNDANNPTIFIIFDPNQVYPEYLIEYQ